MSSMSWTKFNIEAGEEVLVTPCLSLTLYLERVDEEGVLDFYEQATAALGHLLTHYDTGSGKPKKLDARGRSVVPSWKGKMNQTRVGLFVRFKGNALGTSSSELEFFINLDPHASPVEAEAKKYWEKVLKPAFEKYGGVDIFASAQLRVCLPVEHPLAKDFDRLRAWVGGLRLVREGHFISGQCGYGLRYHGEASGSNDAAVADGLRRLCLQHPGLDFDMSLGFLKLLGYQPPDRVLHRVRRANWLTLLSGNCVEQLGGRERVEAGLVGGSVRVHVLGEGALMIQAGPKPGVGDPAAGDFLPEYRQVAQFIRPIRIESLDRAPVGADDDWVQEWLELLEKAPA